MIELEPLAAGDFGVRRTLRLMARMARRPELSVERFARGAVTEAGGVLGVALGRLFRFVRDSVQNRRDPPGVELVQAPRLTLEDRPAGDCDDKATLLAALFRALGVRVRFVAIDTTGERFDHVYLEAQVGGLWMPFDAFVPFAVPGWAYPDPARTMRVLV